VSPFLNVLTSVLIVYSFYNMSESQYKQVVLKIINYTVALMFPYILNAGYATCSGIYVLLPIEERQRKTRHILKMSGMQTSSYWVGLFMADYFLFLIPTALFGVLVGVSGLQIFSDHLFQFIGGMLGFGLAVIALTYLLSTFFDSADAAIKCNIYFQLLVGTFLPFIIMGIVGARSESVTRTQFVLTFFYFFNPMFTFYLTNYLIVLEWINTITPDIVALSIPLSFGYEVSLRLSLITFASQSLIYLLLTMWRDNSATNRFRSYRNHSVKLTQPQMPIN
jgi:hypothetical protein